jgi:hypothetical protein
LPDRFGEGRGDKVRGLGLAANFLNERDLASPDYAR